jgi:hypothetical protein
MVGANLTDTLKDAMTLPQAAHLFCPVPHVATLHRWSTRGTRGVKLQTWLSGGKRVTTPAAVEQFLRDLNAAAEADPRDLEADARRRADAAGRALEALGA